MLVGINYQIEFEKIPELVTRLLAEALSLVEGDDLDSYINCHLRNALADAELMMGKSNYIEAIKLIDEARKHLVTIDVALSNCSDILRGYTKQLVDPQPPQEGEAGQLPDFSDIQEKLAELQQNIGEKNDN